MSINIDQIIDSPDRRLRKTNAWVGICIHHTGLGKSIPVTDALWRRFDNAVLRWLSIKDKFYVSAHYQIGRDGRVTQLVDPDIHVAYHAGRSRWFHPIARRVVKNLNEYFIGIELLGDGNRVEYTEVQYEKLSELCSDLRFKYQTIHPLCIVGHEHISPGRKVDPGRYFDWKLFFDTLFS